MKRTVIAVVLFALIIGLCLGTGRFLQQQSNQLSETLTHMENAYRQKDLTACRALAEKAVSDFETAEAIYPYFFNHKTVHDMSESLQKLPIWLECGDDSAFYAELVHCRLLAEEMCRAERLLPENIF